MHCPAYQAFGLISVGYSWVHQRPRSVNAWPPRRAHHRPRERFGVNSYFVITLFFFYCKKHLNFFEGEGLRTPLLPYLTCFSFTSAYLSTGAACSGLFLFFLFVFLSYVVLLPLRCCPSCKKQKQKTTATTQGQQTKKKKSLFLALFHTLFSRSSDHWTYLGGI